MTDDTRTRLLLDVTRYNTRPGDQSRELPGEIVAAFKECGYFSLLLPEQYGGAQMNYPEYLELVKAVARLDASTAWCMNQGSVLASLARFIDPKFGNSIWTDPGVVLANGPPAGPCYSSETDSGYRLTGTWNFSSGIAHADWLIGIAMATGIDGSKKPVWHFFPKSDAVINATWEVAGLRRTGSYTFSVTELEIPGGYAFEQVIREPDSPLYQIPLNLLFAGGFASVALGVCEAAMEFSLERTKTKIRRFDQDSMQHDATTQDAIGRAEAILAAADNYLTHTVDSIWSDTRARGKCTTESKYTLRLAATHVIRESKRATDLLYDLCSTDGIHQDAPIHRYFQDIHVISQHLQGRPEIYSLVGSYRLGIPRDSFLID